MAFQKPQVPKGTRDFSPGEMVRRNYIFDTIRSVFKKYGYQPIETPSMELTETLMGKYGEEGDRLIFRILDSGNFIEKIPLSKELQATREKLEKLSTSTLNSREAVMQEFESITNLLLRWVDIGLSSQKVANAIAEKALRYDLTVPFARYVVQHQNEITFPFKRYQIQPVWRADRPQKGRYREFYQCDADVIGSESLINEVELVQLVDEVFTLLNIPVIIKINNRKILTGIIEELNIDSSLNTSVIIAIDKLDKIGSDGVAKELMQKGLGQDKIEELFDFLDKKFAYNIPSLASSIGTVDISSYHTFKKSAIGRCGLQELNQVYNNFTPIDEKTNDSIPKLELHTAKLERDFLLARGLNYYTGAIFEVKIDPARCISTFGTSLLGGGRYDDLTGVFGLPGVSGVGISFGADRIYDVLEELNLFPEYVTAGTRLLFINKGGKSESFSLQLLKKVRAAGIAAEIYPDAAKWEKQAKYVDAKKIPFQATVEDNYDADKLIMLKYKNEGKWSTEKLTLNDLIQKLK